MRNFVLINRKTEKPKKTVFLFEDGAWCVLRPYQEALCCVVSLGLLLFLNRKTGKPEATPKPSQNFNGVLGAVRQTGLEFLPYSCPCICPRMSQNGKCLVNVPCDSWYMVFSGAVESVKGS